MLLKIKEMPKDIKSLKVLPWNKLPKKTSFLDGIPKDSTESIVNDPKKPVKTDKLIYVCWQLVKAGIEYDGLGLHCTQVGINKKVFVMKINEEIWKVFFHGSYKISENSESIIQTEGCLSIPGVYLPVARPSKIEASWYEINDQGLLEFGTGTLEGLPARCFMHEMDHQNNISILQRYEETLKTSQNLADPNQNK